MGRKRIVVGLDGSTEATRALEWAADQAVLTGASITAVAVFDVGHYMVRGVAVSATTFEQFRASLRHDLNAWCESLRQRGIAHHIVVREGSASTELLTEAAAKPTDLIVVGAGGRRGDTRERFMGSVAHQVVALARCPVLVMPRLPVSTHQVKIETRATTRA